MNSRRAVFTSITLFAFGFLAIVTQPDFSNADVSAFIFLTAGIVIAALVDVGRKN